MKQKVFALVLSCMMLLSLVVSAASYSDVPETHDRYEAINMLSSLDIITGYPDGTFQPDKEVTRAEMAALITRMFNLTSTAVTEQPFSDVATDYWAVSNIVAAKNMKIINGFPDGTFKPQDNVTYEQAVKMIVCALNYGTAAEALGGYPAGYINQASKLNILQKAAYGNTKPAPRGIIAQLLFNSLKVDMLVPQVNPDGTVDFIKPENGNSVLEQFQKNQTLTGVTVVRTPKVNLLPGVTAIQSVNDDAMYVRTATGEYIKIFVGTYTDAFSFIGHQVDISYQADEFGGDTKTLTSINRSGNVQKYENIKFSNVISLTNTELVYYTDKANERKNTIYFNGTPTVIYNERLHQSGITQLNTDLFSVSNHTYANGVISVYVGSGTLVKAKSYKNYVVDGIDARNEILTVKNVSGQTAKTIDLSIPFDDGYGIETVIKKGSFDYKIGAAAANATNLTRYNGIAKGNIIAVASNTQDAGSKYFEVLVSNTTVSGSINGMETDDETGRNMIKVGTSALTRLSRDLARYGQDASIQMEMSAKFHIDPFGEIGYISDVKTQSVKLGIPVSVKRVGSGFDKVTTLEIYNVDTGNVETYTFQNEADSDKLMDTSRNLITDYLFQYKVKSSKIDTIAKVVSDAADPADDDNYTYDVTTSVVDSEASDITKNSSSKINYSTNTQSFNYNNKDTKVIFITSKRLAMAGETATPKTGSMVNNTPYDGKVYRMKGTGFGYKQYVILRPYEGLAHTSPTYIVESVGGIERPGDINLQTIGVYSFSGTQETGNGAEKTNLVMTEDVVTALQLKKGDVFSYYDGSNTEGIDVEYADKVSVLARAENIATGTAYPAKDYLKIVNTTTKEYNTDFRFWGIKSGEAPLVDPTKSSVYNYYVGIPMEYDGGDASQRTLRMAKDNLSELPVLPSDTTDIATMEANIEDGDYFNHYDITKLTTIYVYDAKAPEAEKLLQLKDKNDIENYLDNLQTIKNNKGKNPQKHDTVVVKTYHSSTNRLYNLYIIKDARPVNP